MQSYNHPTRGSFDALTGETITYTNEISLQQRVIIIEDASNFWTLLCTIRPTFVSISLQNNEIVCCNMSDPPSDVLEITEKLRVKLDFSQIKAMRLFRGDVCTFISKKEINK